MTKIIVALLIFILLGIGGWFGYQKFFASGTNGQLYNGKVTIGTETWPGYIALYVAQDQGFFKEEGVDVDVKLYTALGELSKDYVAGKMQGRANLTLDAINEAQEGFNHKVVLAIDYSNGSDAIIARQGINTVKDFKGKRVGFESGTLEEFFVAWALSENGLSLSDIIPVNGNPEETVKLLQTGKIDVAVSHEPFLSQIISSSQIHTVYSSADASGLITDILTFRSDFINENPASVQAIVRAYFKGLKFWKENPKKAEQILAKKFNDTPENIASAMDGIIMVDESGNKLAFQRGSVFTSLYTNLEKIGEFVSKHSNKTVGNIDNLLEPKFVTQL